jgi:hypothetical protein
VRVALFFIAATENDKKGKLSAADMKLNNKRGQEILFHISFRSRRRLYAPRREIIKNTLANTFLLLFFIIYYLAAVAAAADKRAIVVFVCVMSRITACIV